MSYKKKKLKMLLFVQRMRFQRENSFRKFSLVQKKKKKKFKIDYPTEYLGKKWLYYILLHFISIIEFYI